MKKVKVLFVCLGNICRSPTAHGVFQKLVNDAGLSERVVVDSAGTSGWHIGAPPDKRSAAAARQAGYDLSTLRGRQVAAEDFESFDYVLAMDESNLFDLQEACPPAHSHKLSLFLDFSSQETWREVPDPYYGDGDGFKLVLSLVEDASRGLLKHVNRNDLA